MTNARVLYFAVEDCHRSAVLRYAGYELEQCASEAELALGLRTGPPADLVCVSEGMERPAEGALALALTFSAAPVVLFRCTQHHYLQKADLEVPPLCEPDKWLGDIERLLTLTRGDLAYARGLRELARRGERARMREALRGQLQRR